MNAVQHDEKLKLLSAIQQKEERDRQREEINKSLSLTIGMLEQWGKWERSGGIKIGYPKVLAALQDSIRSGVAGSRPLLDKMIIGDFDALAIHHLLNRLRAVHPHWYTALDMHYVKGKSFVEYGKVIDKSPKYAEMRVKNAQAWVNGALYAEGVLANVPEYIIKNLQKLKQQMTNYDGVMR